MSPGRPRHPWRSNAQMERLQLAVPGTMLRQLERAAQADGLKLDAYVRRALRRDLERNGEAA